jgi:Na+-translocating ferredoxin:NAD+ oxidoreductase subunit B
MTEPDPTPVAEMNSEDPRIAVIDEAKCIGCVKCIRACPVDAILGAAKQVHAVLPGLCTGCGLCLPPCPVDCIRLVRDLLSAKMQNDNLEKQLQTTQDLRARFLAKCRREHNDAPSSTLAPETAQADKRAYLKEAISRSRARRAQIRRPREPDEGQGDD